MDENRIDSRNRRQRVDDAEHALDQSLSAQSSAEKRKMRAMQEMLDADAALTVATQVVDKTRIDLAEAYAYRDPPPVQVPAAPPPQLDMVRDHFAPAGNGLAQEG
jgi:hypothetical protein